MATTAARGDVRPVTVAVADTDLGLGVAASYQLEQVEEALATEHSGERGWTCSRGRPRGDSAEALW